MCKGPYRQLTRDLSTRTRVAGVEVFSRFSYEKESKARASRGWITTLLLNLEELACRVTKPSLAIIERFFVSFLTDDNLGSFAVFVRVEPVWNAVDGSIES